MNGHTELGKKLHVFGVVVPPENVTLHTVIYTVRVQDFAVDVDRKVLDLYM